MTLRLAILDDFQNAVLSVADWTRIEDRVAVTVFRDPLSDPAALIERLFPFDIVVSIRERTRFPRSVLERLPNLKLLVTNGMRNLAIDMEAAREHGIVVTGTDSVASATAELTWGLLLATVRQLPDEVHSVRHGGWQVGLGVGLEGKTLGLLGLGRQGARVARYGLAFGMKVVAWSQNLTEARCAEIGVTKAESRDALLKTADIVSIHLVLSERTRDLLDSRALSLMKPEAFLINTSRGPIIDEDALIAALRDGRLRGAGLDVFDSEPLPPDHPLRHLPRVVTTPHLGYTSLESYQVYFSQGLEAIEGWLAGNPVRVLNP